MTNRSTTRAEAVPSDCAAVVCRDGEVTIDARLIAPRLGLSPERFMAEVRRGLVYQVAEQGVATDAGRMRLTFRYRERECRVFVDQKSGNALSPND